MAMENPTFNVPMFQMQFKCPFSSGISQPRQRQHLGFDELLHAVDVTRGRRQMQRGFLVHGQG